MPRILARKLSPRESALLRLASEGYTDPEISKELGISEGTISTYWGRIRMKLGPHSRTELVAIVIRTELGDEIKRLQSQRDRLKKALEQASTEERLFEEIVDAADEGVLIVSARGQIEHANPVGLDLFGYERSELIGTELANLIPLRFREAHERQLREFAIDPTNRAMNDHSETFGLTKTGDELPLNITISAVERDGVPVLTAFIHPV